MNLDINIDKLFPKIYVINLPEHTERLESTRKELAKIGINNFFVFEGVKINGAKEVKDREAGCRLSHVRIIDQCIADNVDRVLIFEDDIVINENFLNKLNEVKGFILENKWDLFYFGGNFNNHQNRYVNENILQVEYCFATHAYCVSKQAYKKIIEFRTVETPYDILLTLLQREGNSYCVNPRQIYQRQGLSFIQGKEVDYDRVLK